MLYLLQILTNTNKSENWAKFWQKIGLEPLPITSLDA